MNRQLSLKPANGLQPVYFEAGWSPQDGYHFACGNKRVWWAQNWICGTKVENKSGRYVYCEIKPFEYLEDALDELRKSNEARTECAEDTEDAKGADDRPPAL